MSPSEYLVHLQRRQFDPSIGDLDTPLTGDRKRAADEWLQKELQELENTSPGLRKEAENFWKKYGGFGHQIHLKFVNDLAAHSISEAHRGVLDTTVVGELRFHDFNATAIRAPAGGFVIAINLGLFSLLGQLIKLMFTQSIVLDKEGKMTLDIDMPFEIAFEYVMAAIGRYVNNMQRFLGPFVVGPGFVGSREKSSAVAGLNMYADLFVLSHEYGHIVLGHLDSYPTGKIRRAMSSSCRPKASSSGAPFSRR
jgi:hypothetical protein